MIRLVLLLSDTESSLPSSPALRSFTSSHWSVQANTSTLPSYDSLEILNVPGQHAERPEEMKIIRQSRRRRQWDMAARVLLLWSSAAKTILETLMTIGAAEIPLGTAAVTAVADVLGRSRHRSRSRSPRKCGALTCIRIPAETVLVTVVSLSAVVKRCL